MSNLQGRLKKIEEKMNPETPAQIFVYFHDKVKGYAVDVTGEYFETFEELAIAQCWQPSEHDRVIRVLPKDTPPVDRVRVFIPDNGRGDHDNA